MNKKYSPSFEGTSYCTHEVIFMLIEIAEGENPDQRIKDDNYILYLHIIFVV